MLFLFVTLNALKKIIIIITLMLFGKTGKDTVPC